MNSRGHDLGWLDPVETLADWAAAARQQLADHVKRYEWEAVFEILAGLEPSLDSC